MLCRNHQGGQNLNHSEGRELGAARYRRGADRGHRGHFHLCCRRRGSPPMPGAAGGLIGRRVYIGSNIGKEDMTPNSESRSMHQNEFSVRAVLREVAHLRPRTNVIAAATRVRHTLAQAVHRFFDGNGFFWVNTPIITASDAEGAGALFRVSTLDLANLPRTPDGQVDFGKDFFGREAFLTVSGQLNVEAYCLALTKVYTFGPTFRAENSNTSRHLAEFWMIEPEIAFADLSDNATLAERLLKFAFETLLKERADDMAFFEERLDVLDARMTALDIDKEYYAWYRDLRRYGTVPHAGFGLGFERTLAYVTGLANVRDAIPFPRTPGHAKY